MKTKTMVLLHTLMFAAGAVFAQTTATLPSTASNDPGVRGRAAQREANSAYAGALLKAYADRGAKVNAAVEAAVKDADAKGKDPLVAKRNADAKARKDTQAEYDAALKKAADARKAATAAADNKLKAAGK